MASKTSKIQKTIARQQEKYSLRPSLSHHSNLPQLQPFSSAHALSNEVLTLSSTSRISEGNYYEAHQQIRTITARYVKASDWDSAIDVLYSGALALLKAGQGGSGGDLGCFLVEVLGKSERGCGTVEKGSCWVFGFR